MAVAATLCGTSTASNNIPANYNVAIHDGFFPASLTINVGDSVTWRNADNEDHNVTALDNLFTSGDLISGGTYTYTFRASGQEPYQCALHPQERGLIIVN
jgi:plastocyanin